MNRPRSARRASAGPRMFEHDPEKLDHVETEVARQRRAPMHC
jgi:hypothetical protein